MDAGAAGTYAARVTRAVLAFVALPGVVAFLVPVMLVSRRAADLHPGGLLPLTMGTGLLLWCVWIFYRQGKGTLAPWDPPRRLVVSGPYRWSRNPMYVAVMLVLAGWALAYRTSALVVYAACIMVAFQLRITLGEEPWLARTHGDDWIRYRDQVPRWLGLARRGRGSRPSS